MNGNTLVNLVDKISVHNFASKFMIYYRVCHVNYSRGLLSSHCHNFSPNGGMRNAGKIYEQNIQAQCNSTVK